MTLAFSLDRTVEIHARRATVLQFFTDPARFARWWGAGSTIEPAIGGAVRIRYPDGSIASGAITELVEGRRIAFTYGYEDPAKEIRPGGSLVTITLADTDTGGTRVQLRHDVAAATLRTEHIQGWKYQLAVLAKIASDDAQAAAPEAIAAWFAAWNEPSDDRRRALLAPIVTTGVAFRDGFGNATGLDELLAHIAACQRFLPGVRFDAQGAPRISHGTVVADWTMGRPGDDAMMTGTNVFRLSPAGQIAEVIGVAAT
jgi:uncharacterized protein YndB with AHSA1/START domain